MNSRYLLLLFLVIANCKSNSSFNEDAVIFKTFPSIEKIELNVFKEIPDIAVDGLLNYNDSLIVIRNTANTSKYHFTAFDLNKKETVFDILESGRQENQSMAFLSYGISKEKLWVFDIMKNELINTPLKDDKSNETDFFGNAISTFYYAIQPLNDDTFLATGDYDSDYRASIIDLKTNNPIKKIDPYPKDMSRGYKMAYESFLYLNPKKDKAVLAGRFTDRVQIIDLNTEKSIVLSGPVNFEPRVDFMIGNDGKEISFSNIKSKYAFVKGVTTTKNIYLLYSGNLQNGPNFHYGNIIYVYTWDGKPIKKLLLAHYILDFIVLSDDSAIYAYNPSKKSLEFSTL